MPTLSDHEVAYLIHHVVLPPKLPHADDADPGHERVLLNTMIEVLRHLHDIGGTAQTEAAQQFQSMASTIGNLIRSRSTDGSLTEAQVAELLGALSSGEASVVPLEVKAQNAGIIVSRCEDGIVFEVFELSPLNESCSAIKGRLTRSFPTHAYRIPLEKFREEGLIGALSHGIAKMSFQEVPEFQPQTHKAGRVCSEIRDTTHPGLVTDYLVNILSVLGDSTEVNSIWKNTRDDVLWLNTLRPWRRSPLWLLMRVSMQLHFSRFSPTSSSTDSLYKVAMINMLAKVLDIAMEHRATIGSDMLHTVSAKLQRRLRKLKSLQSESSNQLYTTAVQDTLARVTALLEKEWSATMSDPKINIDMSKIHTLQPVNSLNFHIPQLNTFIKQIHSREIQPMASKFHPTSNFPALSETELPRCFEVDGEYKFFQLAAVERWVEDHLQPWLERNLHNESSCNRLGRLMQDYHSFARGVYSNSDQPRSVSAMYLTVVELWVACDRCACHLYPLLLNFDPEVNLEVLQSLSLPFRSQMERLAKAERYVQSRQNTAKKNAPGAPSLFRNFGHPDSFAVKFFDQSTALQQLRSQIEQKATKARQQKCAELVQKKLSYEKLIEQSSEMECDYEEVVTGYYDEFTETRHSRKCKKCALERMAQRITIEVYEWPLSPQLSKAKATIFEHQIPIPFSRWRDATTFLVMDVLGFDFCKCSKPQKSYPLYIQSGLFTSSTIPSEQRIGVLSEIKPWSNTHYKVHRRISFLKDEDVCLSNALQYRYFDDALHSFTDNMQQTNKVIQQCTYKLPARSSKLQHYLGTPLHNEVTPNSVISTLSECPTYLSLDEYKAFGVLSIGHNIQYMNILTQLAMPNVDFAKVETQCLVLQTIHQAGPPLQDGSSERVAHHILRDETFCQTLLRELEEALGRASENWESWRAVWTFVQLTLRVLDINATAKVLSRCLNFLKRARQISLSWLDTLRQRSRITNDTAQRAELCSLSSEIALLCASTFDASPDCLRNMLRSPSATSALIHSSIIVQENKASTSTDHNLLHSALEQSWKLILFRAFPILKAGLLSGDLQNEFDEAIATSLAEFRKGSRWAALNNPLHHWVHTNSDTLDINFNLVTAELYVNGLPSSQLPQEYKAHELYSSLFHQAPIEVMPTSEPGMTISAKHMHFGYKLSFAMQKDYMLVVAAQASKKFDLIPSSVLLNQLPTAFVQNYFHWYDHLEQEIEFRPREDAWSSSVDVWRLKRVGSNWCLAYKQSFLVNPISRTGQSMSKIFSSIENQPHIHVTLDKLSSVVSIELPRLQLSFHFDVGGSLIHSRQYRGMVIDPDQRIWTMVGLSNKLVLKHTKGIDQRLVMIPEGSIMYKKTSNHVKVSIDPDTTTKMHVYQLDNTLGRLIDNGSIQSKLLLCYLHALTSSCVPDALTGHTGTESALSILRSAAVSSFDVLTKQNIALLELIAKLTPGRKYYPEYKQSMQQVQWKKHLSFVSQHSDFYVGVEKLFNQARKTRLFHSTDTYVEPPQLNFVHSGLLRRDMIRSSTFRVDGFGAEHYTHIFDRVYQARSRLDIEERSQNSFITATLVLRDPPALYSTIEAGRFHYSMRNGHFQDAIVEQSKDQLSPAALRFDAMWLKQPCSFLPKMWCDLHSSLSTSPQNFNKFEVMMWLSAAAFTESTDMDVIQTLVAFYRLPEFATINIPPFSKLNLSKGDSLTSKIILGLLQDAQKPFKTCPEYSLPVKQNESIRTSQERKQRLFETNQKTAVDAFASDLENQWPCKKPAIPNTKKADVYLDTDKAMSKILPSFKARYANRQFYKYIEAVSATLAHQTVTKVSSNYIKTIVPPHQSEKKKGAGCLSIQDIFALQAPNLNTRSPSKDGLCWPKPPDMLNLPFQEHSLGNQNTYASDLLSTLCQNLETQANSASEKYYISDLRDSYASLAPRTSVPRIDWPFSNDNLMELLKGYLSDCRQYLKEVNSLLKRTVQCGDDKLTQTQHGPRICPIFWLRQLNMERFDTLSEHWKAIIVQYGLAITEYHRAQRLLALSNRPQDLVEELRNRGHQNWDPTVFPETLLLEAESGIIVREVQEEIAQQMRSPLNNQNSVMQLNMGEGKSSVIVPIVASALSDKKRLVRVIVAKPQSRQMFQMLASKLGGLLNRRIYHMPFSRALKLSVAEANVIGEIYAGCMENRGILLVQPEHILSFRLMGIECIIRGQDDLGRSLLRTQRFFDTSSRDIVDESDENFSVKFELVYTMGTQRPIEMSPERWVVVQSTLSLIVRYAVKVKTILPTSIEVDDQREGRCPRVRILRREAEDMLLDMVAEHICNVAFPQLPIARQPTPVRNGVFRYIRQFNLTTEEIDIVEKGTVWTDAAKYTLLLIRGLIAGGILRFTLSTKRWRVNYGLDSSRSPKTKLAVPYRSKDSPSPRSEFSHPDVVLVLTSLTYYYGGIDDEDLFDTFTHLLKSDQASIEYGEWVRTAGPLPDAFHRLSGVNIKDRHQCVTQIFPRLRYSKGVIDYFLSHIVFPKEMKEFPHKLSASGWDIGAIKTQPTTGFSGTNDSRHVLPLAVHHLDLPKQKHTNALVLAHLLQKENGVELLPPKIELEASDAEHLLKIVNQLDPPTRVILDVGAQILELDNLQVAHAWLHMSDPITTKAVVFFNDKEEISVLDRSGRIELYQTSPFAKQLDVCLIYLDEAHTRGTDLPLPYNYRAAVTLGAALTKDRLVQACMRMRKLGKGQSVVFCISEEIQVKILERTLKDFSSNIDVSDVLIWAITETWSDMRRSIPLWANQGRRFEEHKNLLDGVRTTMRQAKGFLEDEAQSIEYRYRPHLRTQDTSSAFKGWDITNENIQRIIKRCRDFETAEFDSATLQEEQERELSPEVEEERQVQRPPSMEAAKHMLHPDLHLLINTGEIPTKSTAFIPAFSALRSTSLSLRFSCPRIPGTLLVTADFMQTIKRPLEASGKSFVSDSYLRPVQWVLSILKPGGNLIQRRLIIISPFEANLVLPMLRKSSTNATLHLYSPRFSLAYKTLDTLDLYCVGSSYSSSHHHQISRSQIVQLNLFAGQLYFSSYEEYIELCEHLGLAWTTVKNGQSIQADGFLLPPAGKCSLTASPLRFLREFLKMRRDGEGIEKTQIGKVLDGTLLEEGEFE